MKIRFYIFFLLLFQYSYSNTPKYDEDVATILVELRVELHHIHLRYNKLSSIIYTRINTINSFLLKEISLEKKVNLLIEKDLLRERIKKLNSDETTDINKIRYLKGLSIN